MSDLYLGLMSGTSMDAIDGVLADFSSPIPRIVASASLPYPGTVREELLAFCEEPLVTLQQLSSLDVRVGQAFGETARRVLAQSRIAPRQVGGIGSHGQTVYHCPGGPTPTSMQIGDPNVIAHMTGITTVADFRRRDVAAGGQGAPLVPAFHRAIFSDAHEARTIVNIGGMANITILPAEGTGEVTGFDTGPGSVMMDAWVARHRNRPYDDKGQWAATGSVVAPLFDLMLADPYFAAPPPKSTGREQFNISWLVAMLDRLRDTTGLEPAPEDVQATLCEVTAQSIARAIDQYGGNPAKVVVCGGGAHNTMLMKRLTAPLPSATVDPSTAYGLNPNWVEALAFAWLAKQTLEGRAGNLPSVTGARVPVVLGAIYPGRPAGG